MFLIKKINAAASHLLAFILKQPVEQLLRDLPGLNKQLPDWS